MKVHRLIGATFLLASTLIIPARGLATPRLVTVISDLHMGVGFDSPGNWHASEDFRWHEEFRLFLEHLDDEGSGANDLILNGDTFELWETVENDCQYDDPSIGCTEKEALARLERILTAHAPAVAALARFASSESNRVVIVPGDHDAALLFPAVAQRVLQAFGRAAIRIEVQMAGFWASADGKIFVEHGHQIDERANQYAAWPSPFITHAGQRHLERPWGQQAVATFYGKQESRFPTIDNLAEYGTGLGYGLSSSGVTDTGAETAPFLRYVLFRMPWTQFRVDLDAGDVQPPVWDLGAIRAQGATFLSDSLPDDHRFKSLAVSGIQDGRVSQMMMTLTDAEITAVCDYRAAVRRSRRRFERILTQFDPQGPVVTECPRDPATRGGAFDYFWRSRDLTFLRQLQRAQQRLRERDGDPDTQPIAVFVHGHTHLVDWRQRVLQSTSQGVKVIGDGFSPVRGALTPVVVNGGAWQRSITPVQIEALKKAHTLTDTKLFETLRPEHLAPCYSFVQIKPYEERPDLPVIRYWQNGPSGWETAATCNMKPNLSSGG